MRIRRFLAATALTGVLSVGMSAGTSAIAGPGTHASPVTVPAGMTKAQFCQRALPFFTYFDGLLADALQRLQDAVAAAHAAGNTARAQALQDRLTRGQAWVDQIHQFENRIRSFCQT